MGGLQALKWNEELADNLSNITWGDLSPLGKKEHYDIASRIFLRFPDLFSEKKSVQMDATEVYRTQQSRASALAAFHDHGAPADIFVLTPAPKCIPNQYPPLLYTQLRFFDVCENYITYLENNPLVEKLDSFIQENIGDAVNRIHGVLFNPSFIKTKTIQEQQEFTFGLYGATCQTQVDYFNDYDHMCSFIDRESARLLAYIADLEQFIKKGPVSTPVVTKMSCELIQSFLNDIDTIVQGKINISAHFRFAHFETTTPVLSALGLLKEDPFIWETDDFEKRQFNGHVFGTMANNLQIAVYLCSDNQYKVKVLQNEVPRLIQGCSDMLCNWDEFRSILAKQACDHNELTDLCTTLICKSN